MKSAVFNCSLSNLFKQQITPSYPIPLQKGQENNLFLCGRTTKDPLDLRGAPLRPP